MLVNVTREHINAGFKGNCHQCPISLAIQESNPDILCCAVYSTFVLIMKLGAITEEYVLPFKARHFIDKFDTYGYEGEYLPFEFNMSKECPIYS